MKLFGFEIKRAVQGQAVLTINEVISRLEALMMTASGVTVDCESAMQSPTVQSIVRAIAGRISTLSIHVYKKSMRDNRVKKEELPNHPVAKLLNRPNEYQDRCQFWLDATSWLVRYGNFYAYKARGQTGPILRLETMPPYSVDPYVNREGQVEYKYTPTSGAQETYFRNELFIARLMASDGIIGNSPVMLCREAIALEIAIEKFGASFFGNSAMPSLIFEYAEGYKGFTTDEQRKEFLNTWQQVYNQKKRFTAALLPLGVKVTDPINVDNERAQFLQTRKYQRTVIAGAWGVPPHLVGDLERATFSNVEQQSLDFVQNVVLTYVKAFEAAMERDLLTVADRNQGIIIRFNLDSALRGDFKTRQEGLAIQRDRGIINANEWREKEGMNPRDDEGGEDYYDKGPSGQEPFGKEQEEPEPEKEEELEPSQNGDTSYAKSKT